MEDGLTTNVKVTAIDKVLRRGYLNKHLTEAVKDEIFECQDVYCCFCGRKLARKDATIEHIIPRSQAEFKIMNHLDNLTISCKKCNSDRVVAEFYAFRRYVAGKDDEAPVGSKAHTRAEKIKKLTIHTVETIINQFCCGNKVTDIAFDLHLSKKTVKRVLRHAGLILSVLAYKEE